MVGGRDQSVTDELGLLVLAAGIGDVPGAEEDVDLQGSVHDVRAGLAGGRDGEQLAGRDGKDGGHLDWLAGAQCRRQRPVGRGHGEVQRPAQRSGGRTVEVQRGGGPLGRGVEQVAVDELGRLGLGGGGKDSGGQGDGGAGGDQDRTRTHEGSNGSAESPAPGGRPAQSAAWAWAWAWARVASARVGSGRRSPYADTGAPSRSLRVRRPMPTCASCCPTASSRYG